MNSILSKLGMKLDTQIDENELYSLAQYFIKQTSNSDEQGEITDKINSKNDELEENDPDYSGDKSYVHNTLNESTECESSIGLDCTVKGAINQANKPLALAVNKCPNTFLPSPHLTSQEQHHSCSYCFKNFLVRAPSTFISELTQGKSHSNAIFVTEHSQQKVT